MSYSVKIESDKNFTKQFVYCSRLCEIGHGHIGILCMNKTAFLSCLPDKLVHREVYYLPREFDKYVALPWLGPLAPREAGGAYHDGCHGLCL